MMFVSGDRVVVIMHDPDPDFQATEIPVGSEGIVIEYRGSCENPITKQEEPTLHVGFYGLSQKDHEWCREENGMLIAQLFECMLMPVDDDDFVVDDGLFEELLGGIT